jgi:flagellar biosynthesis/type III secretory pathway protein FliH
MKESPSVFIGDRHSDVEKEFVADRVLSEFFPDVAVVTTPEGKKVIPIREFLKIRDAMDKVMNGSWERGSRDGYQRGLKEGRAEAERVLQEFNAAVADARKVTFDAVAIDPEITLKIISGVIDKLIDKSSLKIKVNPAHLPVVEQNVDKFLKSDSAIKQYQIEGDSRVKYGGCLIETPTGEIDARLESQFEIINRSLSAGDV